MKSTVIALATVATIANGMNGEQACENRGLNQQSCAAVGCCHWNPQLGCMSSVGQGQCNGNGGQGGQSGSGRFGGNGHGLAPQGGNRGQRFGANGHGRPPMQGGNRAGRYAGRRRVAGKRLAAMENPALVKGEQPSHKDLKDLAKMTEKMIEMDDHVHDILAETGMSMDNLKEYSFDIIADMVASLPDEEFLKLQIEILNERLGDVECAERDDEGNCGDGPSLETIMYDMTHLHKETSDRRRMEKKPWTFWVNFSGQLLSGLMGTIGKLGEQFQG